MLVGPWSDTKVSAHYLGYNGEMSDQVSQCRLRLVWNEQQSFTTSDRHIGPTYWPKVSLWLHRQGNRRAQLFHCTKWLSQYSPDKHYFSLFYHFNATQEHCWMTTQIYTNEKNCSWLSTNSRNSLNRLWNSWHSIYIYTIPQPDVGGIVFYYYSLALLSP